MGKAAVRHGNKDAIQNIKAGSDSQGAVAAVTWKDVGGCNSYTEMGTDMEHVEE